MTAILVGHPVDEIIKAAHDLNASVVVLGRRGAGGFVSAALGGVAYHVAVVSDLPVIVVPMSDLTPAPPLVRETVIGIDGMPESMEAATWAIQTFATAHVTAIHALELAPAFAQADAVAGIDDMYTAARTRAEELMHNRWTRQLLDAGASFDAVIEEGGAVEVLLGAAARVSADLVVVSHRDRYLRCGTLGGVSQRVLAYAPCAAAMVPSPA